MAGKLFLLVAVCALVALSYAEEPAKDEPAKEESEKGKEGDVEGRFGFGSAGGFNRGFNQHGYNRGQSGFNQGSGGFATGNRFDNVNGFRNREGYRTNHGFDVSDHNRYGSGGSGFNTGFNRGAAGGFNQYGQHHGGGGYLG